MIIEPRDMPIKEELTHRRKGGAFDMLARVLRNIKKISFGTGTIMEDRKGVDRPSDVVNTAGFTDARSVFEIYQDKDVLNKKNLMYFGLKGTGANRLTNQIEFGVNAKSGEDSTVGNGVFVIGVSRDGVKYPLSQISLFDSISRTPSNSTEKTAFEQKSTNATMAVEGEYGELALAHAEIVNGSPVINTAILLTKDSIQIIGLPTTNPGIGGKIWNDGGTLKITSET